MKRLLIHRHPNCERCTRIDRELDPDATEVCATAAGVAHPTS